MPGMQMSEQQGQPKNAIPPQVVYYLQPQEVTADDEISLLDLWRVLVSYKWLIVSVTLLTTAIATAIAFYLPPVYRAEVTLAPVTPEEGGRLSALAGELGGIASLAGINIGSGGASSADKAIAVLESRAFTDAFIKDEQLLPVLFSDIWDPQKKVWLVEDQKDTPTLRKAYQVFDGSIRTVKQDNKTGLITLIIEWKDPVQAARWAKLLVERLNQHERARGDCGSREKPCLFEKSVEPDQHIGNTAVNFPYFCGVFFFFFVCLCVGSFCSLR